MKSTIIILTLCLLGITASSCRCDFEEDEPKNRKPEQVENKKNK